MASYDFSVGDFGGSRTKTVTHRGGTVGSLVGMVVNSCKVVNPSGVVEDWTSGFTGGAASTVAFAPPSSAYFDEVGTWTLHIRYTLGTVTETLDPITFSVGPSGGTAAGSVAGATTATGLNAQIAQLATTATASNPAWIVLPEGTVTLDDTIDLASHVYLRAEYPGATRLTRSDAPAVGLADDPTNAVMLGAATVAGASTALTADAAEGDLSLTVTSTTGFTAGDWILLSSVNGTDALGDSGPSQGVGHPDQPVYHLAQIDTVTDPTHLLLTAPIQGYFSALDDATFDPCTVSECVPVEDVRIEGLFFDCAGGSVACGITLRSCVNVRVEDCRFRGFSRASINLDRGTREWVVEDIRREGETNCDLLVESTRNGGLDGLTCASGVARSHANGVPRLSVTSRLRNCGVSYQNLDIQSCQGGVSEWGDWHYLIKNVHVRDCDSTDRQSRATVDELHVGLTLGVGLDMGTTSTVNGFTAFSADGLIENFIVEDVTTPNGALSMYLHDANNIKFRGLSVVNKGRSPSAVGARAMNGVVISDVGGNSLIDGLHIIGVGGAALEFQNAGFTSGGTLRGLVIERAAGTTPTAGTVGIYFNTDANGTSYTLLEDVRINNYGTQWAFGTGFVMYGLRVKNLIFDGVWRQVDECIVVRNNAGASFNPYSLGEISNGGAGTQQVYVVASGGAESAKNVVIYSPTAAATTSTFLLAGVCARGKSNTILTSRDTAINAGDILVAGAGGNAVVDNTPTNDFAIVGVALTNYALSAGATVQVPVM